MPAVVAGLPRAEKLLHRSDALAQAGLVARRGVLVQRALLDGLIQRGNRLTIDLFSGGFVAFGDALAQVAQLGAQAGGVGPVTGGTAFGLTGAFQRRKMISHV
jgi:hypothetical protein